MKLASLVSALALVFTAVTCQETFVVKDNEPCDGNAVPLGAMVKCASSNHECRWRSMQVAEGKRCLPVTRLQHGDLCDLYNLEQKCRDGLVCEMDPPYVGYKREYRCRAPMAQPDNAEQRCDPYGPQPQCPEGLTCQTSDPPYVGYVRSYYCRS